MYHSKYLKYKQKYLNLKKITGGTTLVKLINQDNITKKFFIDIDELIDDDYTFKDLFKKLNIYPYYASFDNSHDILSFKIGLFLHKLSMQSPIYYNDKFDIYKYQHELISRNNTAIIDIINNNIYKELNKETNILVSLYSSNITKEINKNVIQQFNLSNFKDITDDYTVILMDINFKYNEKTDIELFDILNANIIKKEIIFEKDTSIPKDTHILPNTDMFYIKYEVILNNEILYKILEETTDKYKKDIINNILEKYSHIFINNKKITFFVIKAYIDYSSDNNFEKYIYIELNKIKNKFVKELNIQLFTGELYIN